MTVYKLKLVSSFISKVILRRLFVKGVKDNQSQRFFFSHLAESCMQSPQWYCVGVQTHPSELFFLPARHLQLGATVDCGCSCPQEEQRLNKQTSPCYNIS